MRLSKKDREKSKVQKQIDDLRTIPEKDLNPLQKEKLEGLVSKLAELEKEPEAPKRVRKPPKPKIDVDKVRQEAEATLDFIGLAREGLGVKKELPEKARAFFVASYVQLSEKYGPILFKWAPEVMMGLSLIYIFMDTKKELALVAAEKKTKEPKKPETKSGLTIVESESKHSDE